MAIVTALSGSLLAIAAESGAVTIRDAGAHSNASLTAEQLARRNGWKTVEGAAARFAGDLCVENERLILVLRKGARGAECYGKPGGQPLKVADIAPAPGTGKGRRLESFKVIESTPASARIEARFAGSGGGATISFLLKSGAPFVETTAGAGARGVLVESRSSYAILPDLYAGDLVLTARDAKLASCRFPSEHMLLHLTESRDAAVMCVWRSRDQGVTLRADGSGAGRAFIATEIEFGREPGVGVWVAVLAAPAIWHEAPISSLHPVKDTLLDWKVPFRALWRANLPRTDGLNDSWKCPLRTSKGDYEDIGFSLKKARTVWTSARGTFAYPPCIEGEKCYLRKTRFEAQPDIQYDDSRFAVIYPFRAIERGPAGTFGAFDVLREALKGTPQASLHEDLQIKKVARDQWPPTCSVTGEYEKIFDAGEERAKKKFLLGRLEEMNNFVIGIRSRMNEFLDWAKRTREFIAQAKAAKPPPATLAEEFDGILANFGKVYERRKLDERNPAAARVLIDKVVPLIDSDEDREKKVEKVKQLGRDTRTIGGNQDSALGEFRMFAKQLRQRAGIRMTEAPDDATFDFSRQVRQRTVEVLQCAFGHESAAAD